MRVLIATDGSAAADTAVELAGNVAWPEDSRLRVVEVVESAEAGFGGGPWPAISLAEAGDIETALRDHAGQTVDRAVRHLSREGLTVEGVMPAGRPATAIVREAGSFGADLIIVGSRGHGTIETMLLGSVSAEVVDHAHVPVLVARGRAIRRVEMAWDGSTSAACAARLLTAWPIFGPAEIEVTSIADVHFPWWAGFPGPGAPELVPLSLDATDSARDRHLQMADELATTLCQAGLRAGGVERSGDPATEIVREASSWPADLILMGTHGRSRVGRLLLGSVARNVLHHAPCSVLVVREQVAAQAADAGHEAVPDPAAVASRPD
jgi:nucleotide-binding universal stress UspA family protein